MNQGGKRKGAACVYLEPWHADIEEFLELRDNTGDEARRTHNLNLANWMPDLFMRRVEADAQWSPVRSESRARTSSTCWGDAVRGRLRRRPKPRRPRAKQVKARELYARMMRTLARDRQRLDDVQGQVQPRVQPDRAPTATWSTCRTCAPRSSRSRSQDETAVCNLGSINLGQPRRMRTTGSTSTKLAETVRVAVRQLDRVIDLNFYPIETPRTSNLQVAPGRPRRDGPAGRVLPNCACRSIRAEARDLSTRIAEEIYFHALVDLAASSRWRTRPASVVRRHACRNG